MQKIFAVLNAIYDFCAHIWQYVVDFFKDVFLSLWDMLKDVFYWLFETILNLAISILDGFDFTAFNQYAQSFGSLPSDIINICGLIGLGTCLSLILTSLTIRLALQLIPFTRLGS